VFHDTSNGAATSSPAIWLVPSKKVTPATATLSVAVALMTTVPDTVPPPGAAIVTVGANLSTTTLTFTIPVVDCPNSSLIS
jgi:hypothetical protein